MRRYLAVSWCLLLPAAAGCGGSSMTPPTAPTQNLLPDGTYRLHVSAPFGFDGCSGLTGEELFLSRSLTFTLTRVGDEWVGRPPFPHLGDAELRLREVGAGAVMASLAGSLEGTGITAQGSVEGGIALGVEFGAPGAEPVHMSGSSPRSGSSTALGSVTGRIVFIDMFSAPVTCSSGRWTLFRDPSQ